MSDMRTAFEAWRDSPLGPTDEYATFEHTNEGLMAFTNAVAWGAWRAAWEHRQPEINARIKDINSANSSAIWLMKKCDDLRAEVATLRNIKEAAENLIRVKGRHHSEIAYQRLVEAMEASK